MIDEPDLKWQFDGKKQTMSLNGQLKYAFWVQGDGGAVEEYKSILSKFGYIVEEQETLK